ncbi:hypothetical protein MSS2_00445 [Mycobacterium marinum]|uniref:Uncharacterized protein n=1 Tax=Mycobacterium ulcerans str. Harvey TaxID=1299332 RepID=A0ABP3AMK5_MYCUL|nr:hypothetical protein I551_2638 [Mycobacterium ulcerans str. Harvey]RFZ59106.1 hypothetical protein MSS2_00445 [Mycobacterium marinum]
MSRYCRADAKSQMHRRVGAILCLLAEEKLAEEKLAEEK